MDGFDLGQLAKRNLSSGGGGDDDLAQSPKIFAEIAAVAQVDGIALQSFDGSSQWHATQGNLQHLLDVPNVEAITGNSVAIDAELDVIASHRALSKGAKRAWHRFDDC